MSATARMLKPYFVRHWPALAAACVATVVLTAAELAKPWPLKFVLDELLGGREGGFDLSGDEMSFLALMGLAVVAIAAVEAVGKVYADSLMQTAGERIMHALRLAVYGHLQRLSLGFHQRRQKGDLVTRVTGDVTAIGELFAQSVGQMVQSALFVVGMVVVTFVLDPLLGLVSFLMLPLVAAMSVGFRRNIRHNAKRQRDADGEIASLADEALAAMPVVKAFGSERYEHHRVKRRSLRRLQLGIELRRLQTRYQGIVAILISIGTALVLVVGALRVAAGAMTPGDLVVFAMYARMVDRPVRTFAKEYTKAARVLAKADRLAEILGADEVLEERAGGWRGGRARGDIALEGVSFTYGDDRPVIEDVSLEMPAGSRVALIGASGAGKSTVGALIARFYDPCAGRVLLDGRDVRDCALDWLRSQFGLLLQDTMLFAGTVEENIAYGSGASHDRVVAAARAADAHDFIVAMPAGYQTVLGPHGIGLSGGQRQRIGIARTLLRDPAVLILDEPTTGLDVNSERQVIDALWRLMEGRTTILITHSLALVRSVDQVVVMEAGRVVAAGAPQEVLAGGVPVAHPHGGGPRRAAPSPRHPVPRDAALPQLDRLLDLDRMAERLDGTLEDGEKVTDVRIARVLYQPGERVSVHLQASIDGARHDAVAVAVAGQDLSREVVSHAFVALARRVNGRTPGRVPVVYDPSLDAMLSWLPFEPALPALSLSRPVLAARIGAVAEDLRGAAPEQSERLHAACARIADGDGELERLAYRPGRRAVLRFGDHLIKVYGEGGSHQRALVALRQAAGSWIPTPDLLAAFPDLRMTLQTTVPGTPPRAAADAARDAGALVAAVQASAFEGLPRHTSETILAASMRKAQLLKVVAPELEGRVERLIRRLVATRPDDPPPVAAHGDFRRDRVVLDHGELRVVDLEHLCLAPPALDVATYAAAVVRGRPDDLACVEAVLEALVAGYGGRPPGLRWHLAATALGRATRPFDHQLPDWPQRVDSTLTTTESLLNSPLLEETP